MSSLARHRILVVDPDPSIRVLIVALLRRDGHDADAAGDASEALRLGRTRQHAAVVLEPRMHGGDALLDALQSVGPDGKSNVIVVTTPDGSQTYAGVPGVRDVLLKPFRIEELAAIVADCCDGGGRH
jgi:DNA-binding response OmpR family regulator